MQFNPAWQCSSLLPMQPVKESDANHFNQDRFVWFFKFPCQLSKPGCEVFPCSPDLIQRARAKPLILKMLMSCSAVRNLTGLKQL
jgi:hypothetical protein